MQKKKNLYYTDRFEFHTSFKIAIEKLSCEGGCVIYRCNLRNGNELFCMEFYSNIYKLKNKLTHNMQRVMRLLSSKKLLLQVSL